MNANNNNQSNSIRISKKSCIKDTVNPEFVHVLLPTPDINANHFSAVEIPAAYISDDERFPRHYNRITGLSYEQDFHVYEHYYQPDGTTIKKPAYSISGNIVSKIFDPNFLPLLVNMTADSHDTVEIEENYEEEKEI